MEAILNKNLIELNVSSTDKGDIIKELSKLIASEDRLKDYDSYVEEVLNRESLTTTGIGFGIAIPHGKCDSVKVPTVAFGRIKEGVDWNSLDGEPVNVVFLLAVPNEAESNHHLKILAALSRKLLDENFRDSLLNIDDKDKLLELLGETFEKALQ